MKKYLVVCRESDYKIDADDFDNIDGCLCLFAEEILVAQFKSWDCIILIDQEPKEKSKETEWNAHEEITKLLKGFSYVQGK